MSVVNAPRSFAASRQFSEQAAADLAEARYLFRVTLIVATGTLLALLAQVFG